MTFKDKILLLIISIFTLGVYPFIIFRRKNHGVAHELSHAHKLTLNIDHLRKFIGGEKNIAGSEYTNSKVKIFLKNREKVDIGELKKMRDISGVFADSRSVTIIVGKQAKLISLAL